MLLSSIKMQNPPYIIAITGGIGSGKSVVSHLLLLMDVPVYDCDSEAKRLMSESIAIREALTEVVGTEVYGAEGKLNRAYLASYMFDNAERVTQVNHIVHPVVRADFKTWAQQLGKKVVAVESAILFEAGMDADVDAVWVVHAAEDVRLQRTVNRDTSNIEAVCRRMKCQMSEQEYVRRADRVVYNDGSQSLIQQVSELLCAIHVN